MKDYISDVQGSMNLSNPMNSKILKLITIYEQLKYMIMTVIATVT